MPDNILPCHFRCGSHTLNLVSSKDAIEALRSDQTYKMQHESAFTKLNALCCKANRPKSNEIICDILKKSIKVPCKTRWNSLFDCIQHILKIVIRVLNVVMDKLELLTFLERDIDFLTEYLKVMKPICIGVDELQSNRHYAFFMPTLHNIKYELEALAETNLKYCKPLLEAVSNGFFRRFSRFFDFSDEKCMAAVIATCSHPYFKMRWLHKEYYNDETLKLIENKMVQAAVEISNDGEQIRPESTEGIFIILF